MRTTDNLEESVSSFYAELARIKSLLDSINNEVPVFYLLDEILKGTNSDDRHKGSISLIKQLNQKNAFGLVSTHDLTLSAMEKDNELIKNFSFNSTIDANEILFDYKLTDGPCRSFNASKLMEKMGIIVN
jgi:DNA mismatch repair ATPase MutS